MIRQLHIRIDDGMFDANQARGNPLVTETGFKPVAVTVMGSVGLVRDVVERAVAAAGVDVIDLTREADEPVDVIVLVDPADEHWETASRLGVPMIYVSSEKLPSDAVAAAINRGAEAVVDSWFGLRHLLHAIHGAASGIHLTPAQTKDLLDALKQQNLVAVDQPPRLPRRESAVLRLLADGATVEDMAATLELSHQAVLNVQDRLQTRLGAANRAETLERARALGLLPD